MRWSITVAAEAAAVALVLSIETVDCCCFSKHNQRNQSNALLKPIETELVRKKADVRHKHVECASVGNQQHATKWRAIETSIVATATAILKLSKNLNTCGNRFDICGRICDFIFDRLHHMLARARVNFADVTVVLLGVIRVLPR